MTSATVATAQEALVSTECEGENDIAREIRFRSCLQAEQDLTTHVFVDLLFVSLLYMLHRKHADYH